MTKKQYIVSLDQGTSSCRAVLVNSLGEIVAIEQKEFTQIFPKASWVEHDPMEIWDTQMQVFENLLSANKITYKDIIGIGITNQRETTVVWDKVTGIPVYNAIVWQDRRTASICELMKQDGLESYVKENTGLVVDAYFSGTKVKWILDNVDGAREKAEQAELCFGTIDTWLIWKLTEGVSHVTDHTNASRTMMYNIKSLSWDEKLLNALDVPNSMLPKVQDSASVFGHFKKEEVAIPICGVAGDQQSALFGQACFAPGEAKNTYGTGCFLLMNIGKEFMTSQSGLLTTLCCDAQGKVAYALEGSVFIAGAAIQWLRDGLKIIKDSKETQSIAESIPDENEVVVVPAFSGLGAPYWDMYARGAIFGLTRGADDRQIIKATVNSLALQSKDVLDAMIKDSNLSLDILRVDGGASANDYLLQFQSDMLQTKIERPTNVESTAMGAAYLAGMTLGIWDASLISNNRKVDQVFSPQMDDEKRIKLTKQWNKAIQKTMSWIDKEEV